MKPSLRAVLARMDQRHRPAAARTASGHRCPPVRCSVCDVFFVRPMTAQERADRGAIGGDVAAAVEKTSGLYAGFEGLDGEGDGA